MSGTYSHPQNLRAVSQGKVSKGEVVHATWPTCYLLHEKMYIIQPLLLRPPLNSSLFPPHLLLLLSFISAPSITHSSLIALNSALFSYYPQLFVPHSSLLTQSP